MPCIGEAAGEDAESLSGIGLGQHLHAGNPLNPFKAATAWGNQPQGKAMLIRERLLPHVCRQQSLTRFLQWQAPSVACHRDETHVARILVKGNLVEQASNTDTSPALGAIKPT